MDNLFVTALAQARSDPTSRLSAECRRVLEAVAATGKKGSIQLTLTFVPQEGDDGAVVIEPKIKVTAPEAPIPASVFFITEDFGLARTDPRQAAMFDENGKPKLKGIDGSMIAAG